MFDNILIMKVKLTTALKHLSDARLNLQKANFEANLLEHLLIMKMIEKSSKLENELQQFIEAIEQRGN